MTKEQNMYILDKFLTKQLTFEEFCQLKNSLVNEQEIITKKEGVDTMSNSPVVVKGMKYQNMLTTLNTFGVGLILLYLIDNTYFEYDFFSGKAVAIINTLIAGLNWVKGKL